MTLATAILALATAVSQPATADQSTVVVEARRILPSVGLMNDHMHEAGEFMIGVRYQHFDWGGKNHQGTRSVTDADLISAGYMVHAKSALLY